jgi:hypothetical protein
MLFLQKPKHQLGAETASTQPKLQFGYRKSGAHMEGVNGRRNDLKTRVCKTRRSEL